MPALQDSIDTVRVAAQAANDIKAMDIVAFDVSQPIAITDTVSYTHLTLPTTPYV